ncbi:hypothetical protein [Pseudorhodoferax aquiterrae]|nr:hypothetical protein [Pseudorhodoferax aquiterrae]
MTEAKRGPGRPKGPTGEARERRAMYLPAALWAKIDLYGKDWLERLIANAKPPKE